MTLRVLLAATAMAATLAPARPVPAQTPPQPPASAATGAPTPPATEIYLAPIRLAPDGPSMGPARNVSENPKGYDNQPFFGTDGRTMLFASNRDGKQTDIYFLELQTRQTRQFTRTAESEYSPQVMPDEAGVSVIRVEADGTQRVWAFGADGGAPKLVLPTVKPAGYHAWIDGGRLAVFVLGQPPTLQVASSTGGAPKMVAQGVGRSLLRRPTGEITFVQREGEGWMVKAFDPASDEIRPVVAALEGSAERDAAWGPDGTLFMTRGAEVHFWRPGQDGFRLLSNPGIGQLSRLAISRDGRWMALVAAEAQN